MAFNIALEVRRTMKPLLAANHPLSRHEQGGGATPKAARRLDPGREKLLPFSYRPPRCRSAIHKPKVRLATCENVEASCSGHKAIVLRALLQGAPSF